jgi:MarR family 2-MHQ and catechol resistance regulon transcriptional repressor
MPVKFTFNDNLQLTVWMLLHQTYNSIRKCENDVFAKTGITTQQHAILMAIKYANAPASPTQIADWVDRNPNSITLIIDRMEKNGLVKRVRDFKDRRSIRIAMTEKGERCLAESTVIGWDLIKEILDILSDEEMEKLKELLEKVRLQAVRHLQDEKNLKEIVVNKRKQMTDFLEKMHPG